jgi:hypothetical protein
VSSQPILKASPAARLPLLTNAHLLPAFHSPLLTLAYPVLPIKQYCSPCQTETDFVPNRIQVKQPAFIGCRKSRSVWIVNIGVPQLCFSILLYISIASINRDSASLNRPLLTDPTQISTPNQSCLTHLRRQHHIFSHTMLMAGMSSTCFYFGGHGLRTLP